MNQTPTTVVVGAGPAGLAVAACLRKRGVPFVLLEQSEHVGSVWHGHYDRLHLHTPKWHSTLPFAPYPSTYPRYPSRSQFIRYLGDYAQRFEISPLFGHEVTSATRYDGEWNVQAGNRSFRSKNLVLCTGYNRAPVRPTWPDMETFPGSVIHSSEYRNGLPFRSQRVLVVGFGNSGGEIAIDLCEHGAIASVAVRSPVNVIPRDIFGLPATSVSILSSPLPAKLVDRLNAPLLRRLYGDITDLGFRKLPYGPIEQIRKHARIPLIDIGTIDLIREGHLQVRPGIDRFDNGNVVFDNGRVEPFDAVILATGYRPNLGRILTNGEKELVDGASQIRSGTEIRPGLFLCGFYVPPTGTLREISREAAAIARVILGR